MNDAEYLFRQTEIDRKRDSYGDKHKKRQGGRTVRFPSDHLTKKEKEAMNGEVVTYKDKLFYSWDEFRALPEDLQIKWINSIINRYDTSVKSISGIVFGSRERLRSHINSKGYGEYINKGPRGRAVDKGNKKLTADYEAFKNGQKTAVKPQEPEDAELQAQEPGTPAGGQNGGNPFTIRDACVELARENAEKIDVTRIAELLRALSGTGAKLTIEVVL